MIFTKQHEPPYLDYISDVLADPFSENPIQYKHYQRRHTVKTRKEGDFLFE